jgi:hypothetical protein
MLLGLAGALSCLIPLVGPVLAVILPLGVGLLTGVQLSLFTVLFTLSRLARDAAQIWQHGVQHAHQFIEVKLQVLI